MKKLLTIIAIIFFVLNSKAIPQPKEDVKEVPKLRVPISIISEAPQELTNRCSMFFKKLMSPEFENAFDFILKDSPIAKDKEKIKNILSQFKKSITIYGSIGGYEAVNCEKVTESLYRLRYISLHTDIPMRWMFTFYRSPQKDWIIINIKFDDLSEFFFSD